MTQTAMRVPLLDTRSQYHALKEDIRSALDQVLESGQYIMDPYVDRFEQAIAAYCGTKHAIGVANGTDALLLTLDALGIGPGDEVITSPFTFFASAEVISQVGATPVFVDIDPVTYNIDAAKLKAAVTDKTKAVIPVHVFGQPADMDEVMDIAEEYNLYVVEDACQAIGGVYKNRPIGGIGTAGCFSFFPTQNLGGSGDGGVVVTNEDELAERIRILCAHWSSPKYYHALVGYNSRLDPLQAAMLQVKLPYLDDWNRKRRELFAAYHEAFRDLPVQLPIVKADREAVFHLYVIWTERRDPLMKYLESRGVSSAAYYPVPLHRQTVYASLGYAERSLPVAERACAGTMALPLYPELTVDMQQYVIENVRSFFAERGELR